ncbi:MAG: DUF115 domain-containing protein [Treponema sp.]|nr:DUF115 domain-containing protein [Treponema sp.]
MNSIWNNNLSAFKKRFPALADLYKNQIDFISNAFVTVSDDASTVLVIGQLFPFWKLEKARSGEWTASENGTYLHSKYRPNVNLNDSQNTDGIKVFLGCGLGYEFINFCKACKNQKKEGVVLLEPEPAHFFAALCILDWTSVFEVEKLIIALNCPIDQIIPLCENLAGDRADLNEMLQIDYVLNPAFVKHDEEYFLSVKKLLDRNIRKNQINENTKKKFGKLWERNARLNAPYAEKCDGVESFRNAFAKDLRPWLLVAAGPSLEKILPRMKELKEKCIVICVDTALRAMLKAGVEPDFIVLTDPQFWAYMHIAGLKSPSSILIADAVSYPAVFRFQCKKIIMSSSPFPISEDLKKIFEGKGELESGGSVATVAWSFAVMAGAKKIYTAGLDLSFPKKQTHIKGSTFEQAVHRVSTKISTGERRTSDILFGADITVAKDYNGNDVLTDSRMKMFAWWFESKIAATPGVETFTLCPESMMIPGVRVEKNPEIFPKKVP